MLAAIFFLSTSYVEWYFQEHELKAVYPFDAELATPAAAGVPGMTDERFVTEDGETLVVWRAKPAAGKPTILYFPGNAGGLKGRSERFADLMAAGFGIVAPAYRGSSGSTGEPEEEVLLADARAIARAQSGVEIFIYGESLGSAVAVRLAAEGLGSRVVLESPFTSIAALIREQHPSEDLNDVITQRWESDRFIADVRQPLLIVHGDRDHLVPFAMGQDMFEQAGSSEKQFLQIEGAGHNRLWTSEMRAALFAFLGS